MSKLTDAAFKKRTRSIMEALIAPQVGRAELADAIGYIENAGSPDAA
mgnify:FL=1